VIDVFSDDEAEHRVAQELEPLVSRQGAVGVLVQIGAMDKSLLEKRLIFKVDA
jgi:hypothetical protein